MAKNNIPADIATVIFADCELEHGNHEEGVWEVTLTSPMVLLAARDDEMIFFPTGTIFYMPFGQMELWRRDAARLAGVASDAIIYGRKREEVTAAVQSDDQMELPF